MLLAIDIGNTNITFGIFKGNRLLKRFDIPTQGYSLNKLKKFLGNLDLGDAIICSVVPAATQIVQRDLKKISGSRVYILGKDTKVPLKNRYRNPNQVGLDRLVNAYVAVKLYPAPLIVVDFGTAVTFDVISKKKEYLGGMILPGLEISLAALFDKTALLPRIKLERPKELIGRDTKNSMLSGVVHGFAALTDDLAERIKEKIGKHALVIGTGGNIKLIRKYCRQFDKIDRDLTLKGLNLIYRNLLDSAAEIS